MGYGIMPYAVNTDVLRKPHSFCSDPDQFFEWMSGLHLPGIRPEDEAKRTALRELFYCQPHSGSKGWAYGYALQILCERFGGVLNNGHWYPFGDSWLPTIRTALNHLGVPFDPHDLINSGPPVSMPPVDDFPVIGHILRPDLTQLRHNLETADLSTINDPAVTAAITELSEWAHFCATADQEDYDLVCIYS